MIYSLSGKVTHKEDGFLVVGTGGIGFSVFVSRHLLVKISIGQKISLFCFFSPENFELYGFSQKEELSLFKLLITVPGIGPRIALKLINGVGFSHLMEAIVREKGEIISKRGGVGTKTASKVILELREKVKKMDLKHKETVGFEEEELLEEVLRGLGYRKKDIEYATDKVLKGSDKFEEKVRAALKLLAQKYRKR